MKRIELPLCSFALRTLFSLGAETTRSKLRLVDITIVLCGSTHLEF